MGDVTDTLWFPLIFIGVVTLLFGVTCGQIGHMLSKSIVKRWSFIMPGANVTALAALIAFGIYMAIMQTRMDVLRPAMTVYLAAIQACNLMPQQNQTPGGIRY